MSDPATLQVPDGANLAVSVFTSANTGRGTGDSEIGAYYTATGDHAADTAGSSFGIRSTGGWFVTGVDVYTPTMARSSRSATRSPPATTRTARAGRTGCRPTSCTSPRPAGRGSAS